MQNDTMLANDDYSVIVLNLTEIIRTEQDCLFNLIQV